MIITLFSLNLALSMTFIMMTHPLSMGMVLLMQTILIAMITGNLNLNFWYSYILFLILIGGMLVLFMYMTSVASNEKFIFNVKLIIPMMMTPLMMMTLNETTMQMKLINNELMMTNMDKTIQMSLNKYINFPSNSIMAFMIIYLLITLIATVKITNMKKGPIRQMS